ncbi:MAG: hypothetical protein ACKV2T_14635 [Kofleriaceae bacterium]
MASRLAIVGDAVFAYHGVKVLMQYSVRNRRRLRQTGEHAIPRTSTVRGIGVADVATPAIPVTVPAEGSGVLKTIDAPVKEITPASVIKNNWQR